MPDWHDMILLAVALAVIYLLVTLLKLAQVGRKHGRRDDELTTAAKAPAREDADLPARQRSVPETAPPPFLSEAADEETMGPADPFTVRPTPTFEWNDVRELLGEEAASPLPAARPDPAPPAVQKTRRGGFGEALSEHLAKSDMEAEIERMRIEMERMRIEMEELRAERRVSPQYAEAMELSQRGLTAQDVADRMGISLAEAELVQALSRGRQVIEEGEEHGADGNPAGFDKFDRR